MIYTIGAGVGTEFNVDDSNYDKVIIMTDADDDGAHIQILLLTFFYRYMRPMIEKGKVYIALPPLYRLQKGRGKRVRSNMLGLTKNQQKTKRKWVADTPCKDLRDLVK